LKVIVLYGAVEMGLKNPEVIPALYYTQTDVTQNIYHAALQMLNKCYFLAWSYHTLTQFLHSGISKWN